MPAGTVIGHVHLPVGKIGEAAAFYHEALGLGLNTWAAGAAPAGDADAKLFERAIEMPDAECVTAAAESLEPVRYLAERSSDGELMTCDPWGTQLRLRVAQSSGRMG